ncbi:kelch domain-containing protein 10-like [Mya arenaria]|uniref:kelch domain-containing protein 10-like n=1 Tax=Mya arenaria TaxID=6604 RepID=UPI0022E6EA44|nr:kelch domain-containing protein 10-like [Mya arenaria]
MATRKDFAAVVERNSCSSTAKFRNIQPRYKPYDTKRPKGRSGHCMCADDSDIYVFGGYSPMDDRNGVRQSRVLPELWRFNFASQKWSKVASDNTPCTCASASILVHNKKVFVFGGTGYPFGQIMSNTIKTLNLAHRSLPAAGEGHSTGVKTKYLWQLLETSPMSYSGGGEVEDSTPPPAYGQSLLLHRDAIYVFGGAIGYYSEAVSDLHKLNLHTMSWEKLRPTGKVPSGRYKQEVVQYDDKLFVLGGGRLHYAESLDKIYAYDLINNHWTEVVTLPDPMNGYPRPRCSFGCAQEGYNVYISGGRYYSTDIEHKSLSDVWHLRLDTLQWKKLRMRLPESLYFHNAIVSPSGHMYVFGGVHRDGYRAPYLYKIRLPNSMPKLSEICWEKVCVMSRAAKVMTPGHLTEMGVPWNLSDRLHVP